IRARLRGRAPASRRLPTRRPASGRANGARRECDSPFGTPTGMAVSVAHRSAPDEAPASVQPLQLFTPPCFLQPRFGCLPVYVVPSLQVTVTFLALAFATDVLLAPEEDC